MPQLDMPSRENTPLPSLRTADKNVSMTWSKALFFCAAGLSLVMSVYLFFSGHREQGIFVGLWVPSILSAANLLLKGNNHE